MDLALYGRVLRRHRRLLICGLVLALLLSTMAVARVSSKGISFRKHEVWQSQSMLLLTQQGFPWGRAIQSGDSYPGFSNLTDLYSQFANSDAVKFAMRRAGAPKTWKLTATPATPTNLNAALPVIELDGTAYSPKDALRATVLGRNAFLAFVANQQASGGIPQRDRIQLKILEDTTIPKVVQPRKFTLAIVVFIAVMTAFIALAFVFENSRSRAPLAAATDGETAGPATDDADAQPSLRRASSSA